MKMEYILLKRKEKSTFDEKTNTITLHITKSPFQIIKNNFCNIKSDISTEETFDFKSEYIGTFEYNNLIIEFSLKEYAKQSLEYLTININEKKTINISVLEEIDKKLQEEFEKNNYVFITSFDSISEYYCNQIYKKLNNFERNLRQLMFNIYTFSYGIEYYNISFNDDTKNKIKQHRDKSIITTSKDIELLKQSLYQLDYQDITDLLFLPKWNENDNKNKEKLIETVQENGNLNQIIDEINKIGPKSDWERIFEPIVGNIENLEELLNEIRRFRNKVAHCKFFRKNDYEKCSKILKILNKNIKKAIKTTMSLNFMELNIEYLLESSKKTMKLLSEMVSTITQNALENLKLFQKNTLEPLSKKLKDFYLSRRKKILKLKILEKNKFFKRKNNK